MNEMTPEASGQSCCVFISYATSDRKRALSVCKAIERRGTKCWFSSRDVAPGENYQEAIVRSIRTARALVLVFTEAANNSDEIKKELSLASKYKVPVLALRLEQVEPSDAFAYELSTRQWIDAFAGLDHSIDSVVSRISELSNTDPPPSIGLANSPRDPTPSFNRRVGLAAAVSLLLAAGVGFWWWAPGSRQANAHSMTVRLAGFELLSGDLPKSLHDAVDAEINAAFNVDGAVGVSTAPTSEAGEGPAYALGGTIQRNGQTIRVITRLMNERSGATLWTNTYNYDGSEVSRVPRHIAVDAGNVVRCGLFGASTYHKALPDDVLRDYMQFCQGHWDPNLMEGRKALIPAQRVVAAVPDFSWGWAAIAGAYWKVAISAADSRIAGEARASGRQAADRAVAIDSRNSEALYIKAMLLDRRDWIGREGLLKRAVGARRLDCGCEHHQYGWMLLNVGRTAEAIEQLHQANDMLALYVYTPWTLADALVVAGKFEDARTYFDAAIDLAPNPEFAKQLAADKAAEIGDPDLLSDPKLPISADLRDALLKGHRALTTRDSGDKTRAVEALLALPPDHQSDAVARLLADLGATHDAFRIAARIATTREYPGPSLFWNPSMRATLKDPGFLAVATQLGLMKYWKATQTKPDVCSAQDAPSFCSAI